MLNTDVSRESLPGAEIQPDHLPLEHARARDEVIEMIAANTEAFEDGPCAIDDREDADRSDARPATWTESMPHLDDDHPVLGLLDLDVLDRQFADLNAAFASADNVVLHAVACKAVPLLGVLKSYARAGAGCEVASGGELELAVAAGFPPERIVFDSPAKTWTQLRRALGLGVAMNVDNFDELARIDALISDTAAASADEGHSAATSARIGIRVNPQTGAGTIGALSTATSTSKFGIGLADEGMREAIVAAYAKRPWLTQIHIHSGSQGLALDHAARGIRAIIDLVEEINSRVGHRQVTRIDIGGGLSVNFDGDDITPTFADYRRVLGELVPELFDYDLVTEFGRALAAKAGTILTRVEYAKSVGGRRIAMTHAGVQVATRTAYAPADWPLRILPYDVEGRAKSADSGETGSGLVATDVAGPACFAGDLLARNRMLPRLDAGDFIAVPETGAYYFSNPFSYNLLPRVPVWGYRTVKRDDPARELRELREPLDVVRRSGTTSVEFLVVRPGQTPAEILEEASGPDCEA